MIYRYIDIIFHTYVRPHKTYSVSVSKLNVENMTYNRIVCNQFTCYWYIHLQAYVSTVKYIIVLQHICLVALTMFNI